MQRRAWPRRVCLTSLLEVKQNFLSNVPAAESHHNCFGISLSNWKNLFLTGCATCLTRNEKVFLMNHFHFIKVWLLVTSPFASLQLVITSQLPSTESIWHILREYIFYIRRKLERLLTTDFYCIKRLPLYNSPLITRKIIVFWTCLEIISRYGERCYKKVKFPWRIFSSLAVKGLNTTKKI